MDRSLTLGSLAFALALALAAPHAYAVAPDAPAASPAPAADTPSKTPHNATFVLPAGWSQKAEGAAMILTPPEADGSRIAIMDSSAKTADEAVAEGWKLLKLAPKFLVANDAAPKDGWEQRRFYDYDVPANAKRAVFAGVYRRGTKFTVLVGDVDQALAEKRASQLGKINQRLQPADYQRESFKGRTAHAFDEARLKQVADFVEHMRSKFDVPGVAIGIVQDGKVVMARGFGVRALGKPEKVDADTRFMIASNTKALTTLLLAKLVEQGKMTWETPVTSLLPTFKLGDADTTRQVLVKHLICACTGLPRQDLEWIFEYGDLTPTGALATLGTMQPTTKFGELFQYSNPMAAAAGFIAGHVLYPDLELGAAYDRAMQSNVFDPLGMKDTTFDFSRALKADHAMPHAPDIDGKPARALMEVNYSVLPLRPAGAAWSSARDMLRYIEMEIDEGTLAGGKRYIAKEPLLARRAPQVAIGKETTYGMGLEVDTTYGVPVVHHGGDMIGFHSDMIWLPDQKVGAVVLTNGDPGWLLRSLYGRKLLEVLFDGKPEADARLAAAGKTFFAQIDADRKLLTVPPDAAAVAQLAPAYRNDALGPITVRHDGGATVFDFGEWKSAVASRKNPDGTLSFITTVPGMSGIEFVVGAADKGRTLITRDGQHEYVFAEVKAAAPAG